MKKYHFLLADSETTKDGMVADFGATISDRKGNIVTQCAVLIRGIYDSPVEHPLFYNDSMGDLWNKASLDRRYKAYQDMLDSGSRMLASIGALNNWLMMAKAQYDPILTAYNLPFDVGKCRNTGINLDYFHKRFCLWSASVTAYARTKKYRQFILENHLFKPVTKHGNMSYPTNADTMARFILGDNSIPPEPHCALEDVLGYEKPILDQLLKTKSVKWLLNSPKAYNWLDYQVRNNFKPS